MFGILTSIIVVIITTVGVVVDIDGFRLAAKWRVSR